MGNNNKSKPVNKNRNRTRRRREGYLHRSPAVCVVVHDPHGRPMPEQDATEIINRVTELALEKGYLINFTRT